MPGTTDATAVQPGSGWGIARGLPLLLALATGCAIVVPRGLPVLLAVMALGFIATALTSPSTAQGGVAHGGSPANLRRLASQPATAAFLVLAAYCALTALWAPTPAAALVKVSWLVLVILTVALALTLAPTLDDAVTDRLLLGVVAALVVGCLIVVVEVLRGQPIARYLFNTFPPLNPGPSKHVTIEAGRIVAIGPWVMNRNVGALNLLLWPALLCLAAFVHRRPGARTTAWIIAAGVVLATTWASMASEHESSQIAIVVSGAVLALGYSHLPAARLVVLAGWLTAMLAMLPVIVLAHKGGLHEFKPIPETGRARIILWNFTAQKYLEHPIVGVGAHATKVIDEQLKPNARTEPGQPYAQRTGQHAHNVFVQAWFELGVVGALLLLAAGCLLWRAVTRLPWAAQPLALAACTSAMCIGAFTWGLWQEWYLSLFGMTALLAGIGGQAIGRTSAPDLE